MLTNLTHLLNLSQHSVHSLTTFKVLLLECLNNSQQLTLYRRLAHRQLVNKVNGLCPLTAWTPGPAFLGTQFLEFSLTGLDHPISNDIQIFFDLSIQEISL